ncbi:cupin domain-containing protein [Silvibacterium dinghuense]|uniref:Cupin domain-containing protein n=1 Tax=Silvibacterium dinghuense TaxID=1560006 RepID=A0A4Q1SGG0_9BACT|nr:cupin domain-containing protein [Silvibacterium dinghuense]RXS96449.1 cupin domain-containing protein [Silvibacterium dinghuense]GGG90846.1 oxalate decarboxylase [Silvibacterium dinghuense]
MKELTAEKDGLEGVSRRSFLGVGSAALATAAVAGFTAHAQEASAGQKPGGPTSDPGPENRGLLELNSNVNMPPVTDHGDTGPLWYSFDLARKRMEKGGWTHQVTQRELAPSKDLAGVNMRLTAGSFRELHWHTANEWAFMEYGNARVTVLNPDGTMFIDDVSEGDLWFFPAGYPHSIQGLGPDGCQFLLVFDEGNFSEDNTFLLSETVAHTPPEVLMKNSNLTMEEIARLPKEQLYIFPAELPNSLASDRASIGGASVRAPQQYTFKMTAMEPTVKGRGGEVRVVDSKNFPASSTIAAGLVRLKPGAIRELHWHPNASEWQFWLAGKGRMTVMMPEGRARTVDFRANDVGFVPAVAAHYIENTGDTDVLFLEMFKTSQFQDVSLNNWIRRMPPEMAQAHLNLSEATLRKIPAEKQEIIAG